MWNYVCTDLETYQRFPVLPHLELLGKVMFTVFLNESHRDQNIFVSSVYKAQMKN